MRAALQIALVCWLLLLLAAVVRPQMSLSPSQNVEAHLRIERDLADHGARVKSMEEALSELRAYKLPERLAAIEAAQQTNTYILASILIGIVTLLAKDVRNWIGREKK